MAMEHRQILHREFDRLTELTDRAYELMLEAQKGEGPVKLTEKGYGEWAALLLRYHQAIEAIESKDDGGLPSLPSMKAGGS